MNRTPVKQIILLTIFFLTLISNLTAQELDKILDALDKKDLGKSQAKAEVNKDPWLDPDSNLSKIFNADGRGVYSVLEWLGDLTDKEFKTMGKFHKKHNEYISLKVNYSSKTKNLLQMNVLLLHPKHISLLGTGLLEEFHNQEPPGLSVSITEKMKFKKSEAIYYHHKAGGCSLLFKLPKNCTLNIYDKKCADNKDIITLAELLDIDRLAQKLDS